MAKLISNILRMIKPKQKKRTTMLDAYDRVPSVTRKQLNNSDDYILSRL